MERNKEISTDTSKLNDDLSLFFDENSDFALVYKKTEKLVSAVYLITNLFSNDEPMKWLLRKRGGELLSFVLTYKDVLETNHNDFVYNVKTKVLEIISFFEVSFRGGFVSEMNFSILKQEFLNLLVIFNNPVSFSNNSPRGNLAKTFFDVPQESDITKERDERIYKNSKFTAIANNVSFIDIKDKSLNANIDKNNLRKTNRQNMILEFLKRKKESTIKDIAVVIKNCGEKTIQRELNFLISNGVLKRVGVRRWSKYSLKNI